MELTFNYISYVKAKKMSIFPLKLYFSQNPQPKPPRFWIKFKIAERDNSAFS